MRQTTITGQTRSMLDIVYAHELEVGDVFCTSNSQLRNRETNTVLKNTLYQGDFGKWQGEFIYQHKKYSSKKGMAVTTKKTIPPGKAKTNMIFLRAIQK